MQIKHYLLSVIFFVAVSLLTGTDAHAQQKQPTNTSIGLTGSIGASTHLNNFRFVSGDIDLDFTPNFTTSFNFGFIVRRKLTDRLRLQAEPSLSRLGASYSESFELRGFNFQTNSQSQLLYVQLPLLLQITTVTPEQTVFGRHRPETTYHVSAGIFGGYLLDAQFSGENTGAPVGIEFSGTFSNDIKDQYSDFDAGALLGLGLEYGYATKIGLEGRIQYSILPSGEVSGFSFDPHNLAVSLTAYFLF